MFRGQIPHSTGFLLALLSTLILPQPALEASDGATDMSAEQRAQILKKMADELAAGYIYEDKGELIAAELLSAATSDHFGDSETVTDFVAAVNEMLLDQSDDLHLRMGYQSGDDEKATANIRKRPVPKGSPAPGPVNHDDHTHGKPAPTKSSHDQPSRVRQLPQGEGDEQHGFASWSVLEGNVGYVDLRMFGGPDAKAQADEAMMELAGVDALVLDLRQNGGGGPYMVRYLSGFLFDKPTHLTDTFMRGWDEPEERWTLQEGRPTDAYVDLPVFVLISGQTFSAAESFTFGLAINNRITTVGDRTGGGGHFGQMVELGDGFRFFLPRGRTYDPETGLGWESEGIKPDIEAPVGDALEVALQVAQSRARPD